MVCQQHQIPVLSSAMVAGRKVNVVKGRQTSLKESCQQIIANETKTDTACVHVPISSSKEQPKRKAIKRPSHPPPKPPGIPPKVEKPSGNLSPSIAGISVASSVVKNTHSGKFHVVSTPSVDMGRAKWLTVLVAADHALSHKVMTGKMTSFKRLRQKLGLDKVVYHAFHGVDLVNWLIWQAFAATHAGKPSFNIYLHSQSLVLCVQLAYLCALCSLY